VCRNKFYIFFTLIILLLEGCQSRRSFSSTVVCKEPCKLEEPRIIFLFTEYDFGQVEMGSQNICSFEFFNDGEKKLVIESIRPSCGCTVIRAPRTILNSGQSSEITVTYFADFPGKSQKRILISTNDPINPQVELWVTAEVVDSRKSKRMLQSGSPSSLQESPPFRGTLPPKLKKNLRHLNKATGG